MLPADEKLIACGNSAGEIMLYVLVQGVEITTDPIYTSFGGHKAAIESISLRSSVSVGHSSVISSMDTAGVVCFWRLDTVTTGTDMTPSIEEIILGDQKLQLLDKIDLRLQRQLIDIVPLSIDIDPKESNT